MQAAASCHSRTYRSSIIRGAASRHSRTYRSSLQAGIYHTHLSLHHNSSGDSPRALASGDDTHAPPVGIYPRAQGFINKRGSNATRGHTAPCRSQPVATRGRTAHQLLGAQLNATRGHTALHLRRGFTHSPAAGMIPTHCQRGFTHAPVPPSGHLTVVAFRPGSISRIFPPCRCLRNLHQLQVQQLFRR